MSTTPTKTPQDSDWSDEDELAAADLWRSENPNMSVFACDHAMKERYRERIRARPLREFRA